MLLVTTDSIPGASVAHTYGLVTGNTIRAKNIARDIGAGLKSVVGGELQGYTEMMTEARDEAVQRMVWQAERLGADAVVGMRLTTSTVAGSAAEIVAYGTAVKLADTQ